MEKLDSKEAKKLALRVISAIGETNENKIEIGRHQGFKKILKLLFEEDEELTQEIAKTLKHIMTVRQQQGREKEIPARASSQNNFFGMSEKVSTLFSDVGRMVASELFRYFSTGAEGQARLKAANEMNSTLINRFPPSRYPVLSFHVSFFPRHSQFTPPADEVEAFLKEFAERDKVGEAQETAPADTTSAAPSSSTPLTDPQEETNVMLKDLMRSQGALSSLTKVLSETTLTSVGQLDIVETICKLLFRTKKNQEAFLQMDGYSTLQHLFDKITTGPERHEFLESCFQLFFILVLDGRKDMVLFFIIFSLGYF